MLLALHGRTMFESLVEISHFLGFGDVYTIIYGNRKLFTECQPLEGRLLPLKVDTSSLGSLTIFGFSYREPRNKKQYTVPLLLRKVNSQNVKISTF